jgi:hypothetical protein
VVLLERLAAPARTRAPALEFAPRLRQFEQVVDRRHQLAVVPGLAQVVGGPGTDQVHRRLQVGPCGEQDHRQVRMARADLAEQGHALLAGGRVRVEVHVLHHQVDAVVAGQRRQPLLRGRGGTGVDLVQREQRLQRGRHAGVVVDDQDRRHAR